MVAYETWRKGGKNVPDIEAYMPIGKTEAKPEMTVEELDEIWKTYGKLDRGVKYKSITKLLKN